jgi:hypothetical protein
MLHKPSIKGLGIVKVRIFKVTFLGVLWTLPALLRMREVPRGQLSVSVLLFMVNPTAHTSYRYGLIIVYF